jgi:hypothetical protein
MAGKQSRFQANGVTRNIHQALLLNALTKENDYSSKTGKFVFSVLPDSNYKFLNTNSSIEKMIAHTETRN